ncbi:MAG: ABC transporter permease subunit [Pirellulaceae bacterium]|nr:ABC transporter permease subunit [Pirellulaceae bacterium]
MQESTGLRMPRWWVIAQTGLRLSWKSQWLRRMLFLAWLPAVGLGSLLFLYEFSLTQPAERMGALAMLGNMPNSGPVLSSIASNPAGSRREVWAFLLLTLFRYPQGFLMVLVVALVAPPLISRDMQSRAFLLYFSRPLGRVDYVLGKAIVVWTYLALITTVPALSLYVLGVFLSPDFSVIGHTWDLPLRILGASVWLIVPTTALALCFSSMTRESRFAGFAWVAVWALGWVAYANLTALDLHGGQLDVGSFESRWTLISLYHSLGRVQTWVFGLEQDFASVRAPITLLTGLTLISLAVLMRRISAPLRI